MDPTTFSSGKVSAMIASNQISNICNELRVNGTDLARGLNINEAQLNRMRKKKSGFYRAETLRPFNRMNAVIDLAEKVFTKKGIREWFTTPNPYLNDLPPLLCLRTDKEAEKVHALLTALGHGFPA